jgi:hypothetical protein
LDMETQDPNVPEYEQARKDCQAEALTRICAFL